MKWHTIVLIGLVVLFSNCSSNEPQSPQVISGKIVDSQSDEPLSGVVVSIIGSALQTTTNAEGNFNIALDEVLFDRSSSVPLSMSMINYYPKDLNAKVGSLDTFEIVSTNNSTYNYYPPVTLPDNIQTGSLSDLNMNDELISSLVEKLYDKEFKEIHSVLIYKDNKLVLEEYFFGNKDTIQFENNVSVDKSPEHIQWSRTEPHYVASVNKALTGTLVAIALDQAKLSVEDKIKPFLPQYESFFYETDISKLSFDNCLNMTAGFQWDEWGSNDLELLWKSNDFAEYLLSKPWLGIELEWRYNSALPNLLMKTISNITSEDAREWADINFYSKLGINNYKWQSQPDGFPEGAARMYLTPRDMLKIGITYLNDGVWAGEQIIPNSWVNDCFSVKHETTSGDYSNYFWHREIDGYSYISADGDGGNYINIFPNENMVIVITQGNYLRWPYYVNQVNSIMSDYILPSLK